MLKYVILFCIISVCYANPPLRLSGKYNELVFAQRYAISDFFYEYINKPYVDTDSEEFEDYLQKHSLIFEEKRWIITGLWPYDASSKSLTKCVDSYGNELKLDLNSLNTNFKNTLIEKWPLLRINGNEERNWAMHYDNEGTCVTNNGTAYLEQAAELYDKYNLGKKLVDVRIDVRKKYLPYRIIDAAKLAFGTKVVITCIPGDQEQYIYEILLCLNSSGKLQDCQYEVDKSEIYLCETEKLISYPLVPRGYL